VLVVFSIALVLDVLSDQVSAPNGSYYTLWTYLIISYMPYCGFWFSL